jgi:hypothetical protein
MSYFVKIILTIALIALLFGGLSVFSGISGVNAQLSHIGAVFDLLASYAHNLNSCFPVGDLLGAVSAVLAIEGLILLWKMGRFIIKLF